MNAKRHMAEVAMLPCIVCKLTGKGNTPAEVHHLLRSGRRIDDYHVLPLCTPHHRGGMNTEEIVSRHPWRKEFESRYGTEQELLTLTLEELDKVRADYALSRLRPPNARSDITHFIRGPQCSNTTRSNPSTCAIRQRSAARS